METNRTLTATAEGSTREVSRSQASTRPRSIERHCVRVTHRATLARSTRRNGLRLWGDLLAPPARLARSRRVGSIARTVACRVARSRPDRLVTRDCRFVFRACDRGGPKTGTNPVDRARPGSKHHVATDANGVPLPIMLTGAHRHDVTHLLPLIDAIPPIRGIRGRPLQKPQVVYADRGYDSEAHRQKLRDRGIKPGTDSLRRDTQYHRHARLPHDLRFNAIQSDDYPVVRWCLCCTWAARN